MWAVIKFDRKKLSQFKEDLIKKIGDNCEIYIPKIKIEKIKNDKKIKIDKFILGDYLFLFHQDLNNRNLINILKFTKGLKYFLQGFQESQKEIIEFVDQCKRNENSKGYITGDFFELNYANKYKFITGPFIDKIFNLVQIQNKKIQILMGKFKTTVKKEEYLFTPV